MESNTIKCPHCKDTINGKQNSLTRAHTMAVYISILHDEIMAHKYPNLESVKR